MARNKDQVIQVEIGDDASLDVIRLEDNSVLFVVSERRSIQRRTVATVSGRDAARIAKFIVGIPSIGNDGSSDP